MEDPQGIDMSSSKQHVITEERIIAIKAVIIFVIT